MAQNPWGYYDTRQRLDYSKFVASQYWINYQGTKLRAWTFPVTRLQRYQYIYSYRSNVPKGLVFSSGADAELKYRNSVFGLRRARQLRPHPVIISRYIVECTPDVVDVPYNGPYTNSSHLENGLQYIVMCLAKSTGYNQTLPNIELPVSKAYQSALKKQNPMKLGLGENLGEIRETLMMLRQPLQSLSGLLTDFAKTVKRKRKFNGRHLTSTAKAAADTWLEYRYGIMPLVYTAVDTMSLVQKMVWDGFLITKGSHEPIVSETVTQANGVCGDFSVLYSKTSTKTSKVVCTITGEPNNPTTLLDQLGLGVQNWPFIAIELTRLSFVLEWFVDVSGWLRTIVPYDNRYLHSVQLSYKHSHVDVYESTSVTNRYALKQPQPGGAKVTCTQEQLDRVVNPYIPIELNWGSGISTTKRLLDSLSLGFAPTSKLAGKLLSSIRNRT